MRAVVQRVKKGSVTADHQTTGRIGKGLLVLLGVAKGDTPSDADYLANKIVNLRIFEDDSAKMNRSLLSIGGEMLVVSQFTLLGDCRKGRRPSFIAAAGPQKASALYDNFVQQVRRHGVSVETGRFQSTMEVALINDGPVTLVLESR
ncbi:MAG: D-aminoacyl-tRNA deacylase [Desulfobacteraceae bacterium]|jgi:D-tyrosyl-tRNA(Tyr) deacylase|nr:D-aminoacyl-tRNA deacylase [Desulfobacteraceae bacterium]